MATDKMQYGFISASNTVYAVFTFPRLTEKNRLKKRKMH